MRENKHTPGPWKLEWSEGHAWSERRIVTPDGRDERVAVVSLRGAPKQNPVIAEANARLISAAPELLEACEAGDVLGNDGPCLLEYAASLLGNFAPVTASELTRKAQAERAAIAKARGTDL